MDDRYEGWREVSRFFIGEKTNDGNKMHHHTIDEFMSWEEAVASGKLLDWNAPTTG